MQQVCTYLRRCVILVGVVHVVAVVPHVGAQRAPDLTIAEQYLLIAANQERASNGLPPVHLDPVLTAASVSHAREMASHEGISHRFAEEPELAARGASAGAHFSLITENVGEAPSSVILHDMWMHSPGHRANLLDPNVNSIGIAVVPRGDELYAVEDFASTVESLTFDQQEQAVANIVLKSGVQLVADSKDARETCAMAKGHAGSRQPWYIMRYTVGNVREIPAQLQARLDSGKYHQAIVGACSVDRKSSFTAYNIAVMLYP